jgi:hypothetical protein
MRCPCEGEGAVKKDAEVRVMIQERGKGRSQVAAAARAGMSERTVRRYEQRGVLPSQGRQPRTHRTRENPFAADWPWVVSELERDPALQATTLFAVLCARTPERYQAIQLRTLTRHIATWRAVHGPEQEVYFAQDPRPGYMAQSDFTHMTSLAVTLGGVAFPHLLYHLVLPYSNVEAVRVCFSESFEALAEGLEQSLWELGGVPQVHRTDHLGAALRPLSAPGRQEFRERYLGLLAHYGLEASANTAGEAHQNGDVEQGHFRFKEAVDQALRVRGSRDFADRERYAQFLQQIVRRRNDTRRERFAREQTTLRPLPALPLSPTREVRARVSRFSTIQVVGNTYSVPSRLIGVAVVVRVQAETLTVLVGTAVVCMMPRLVGRQGHAIHYAHVIWSLVRKPGAFATYRYRGDLFPTLCFRQSYDRLCQTGPAGADREYVQLLLLAAGIGESVVETALTLLLEAGQLPTAAAVRALVAAPVPPLLATPMVSLAAYDQLLPSRSAHA